MAIRNASLVDLEQLVALDLRAFRHVYRHYPIAPDDLRAQLQRQFHWRITAVPEWSAVAEHNGQIVGTIMCCPTRSTPENFVSWEHETLSGELEIVDLGSPNIYGVNMAILPSAPDSTQSQLFTYLLGRMIFEGRELAFFEARMPGLRRWMLGQCRGTDHSIEELTAGERDQLAESYFEDRVMLGGHPQRRDPELRMYEELGAKLTRVVSGAYHDNSSLNYGVIAVVDNPLPTRMRKHPVQRALGRSVQQLAQYPDATERMLALL